MKRLATYPIFAAALLALPGIAAARDSTTGKASFGKCQVWLGPELNGLAWPDASGTIAAATSGQNLAAYPGEAA